MPHCTAPPSCLGETAMCACRCTDCSDTILGEALAFRFALARIVAEADSRNLGEQLLARIARDALRMR